MNITAIARRMHSPVHGDKGGRMEIEIYLPLARLTCLCSQ